MANKSSVPFRGKYELNWDVLDVIVAGRSAIDSPTGFQLRSGDEARRFIESYGYDLENPIERAELHGIFHEALNFVRKNFLHPENQDGLRLEIPRKIVELSDVGDLLLMASLHFTGQTAETQGIYLRNWACCLLKVMHTIAHIDKDLRATYFGDLQQQIFDRFYKVIHRDSEGVLYLGEREDDPLRVNLVAFETKPKKSRDSTILKLLHKPENVAEDIFDRVGIRFITHTRLDALRVIKYLKEKMIIMAPNIKPSRSRNTLVELDHFRDQVGAQLNRAEEGEISEEQLVQELEVLARSPVVNPENPHSSEFYRAIQFTCRQLIKLRNPLYEDLKALKTLGRAKQLDAEMMKAIDRVDPRYIQREIRFFYPYEVQLVDRKSADENEKGRSAHSEYKRAQVQTAMRRVMSAFLVDGSAGGARDAVR
ncbi:MAG: TIGR04552 family protein [Oligoflexia bacterium]|nr:TIGR04552 family protein [Oligoflexia bacterium]